LQRPVHQAFTNLSSRMDFAQFNTRVCECVWRFHDTIGHLGLLFAESAEFHRARPGHFAEDVRFTETTSTVSKPPSDSDFCGLDSSVCEPVQLSLPPDKPVVGGVRAGRF